MLRLPRLVSSVEVVDQNRRPTGTFIQWWQQVVTLIERAINLIVDLTGIQEQFEIALAQAQAAAASAQAAADAATAQANAAKREQALVNSYIEPASVLSATSDTITIIAHTRYYADGTSAMVNGATVPTTGPSVVNYVYYDDPARTGGAVPYVVDTIAPVQTGDRHVVGAVSVPAAGSPAQPGGPGPRPPGYVEP